MAKLPILLTPNIEEQLSAPERAQLIQDFKDWKGSPNNGNQTNIFGRDVLNKDSTNLRHVHMVPLVAVAQPAAVVVPQVPPPPSSALKKWQDVYNNNQKHAANQDQTSNRYLFYAYDRRYGFLLIALINNKAHDIWDIKYQSVLENWEDIAEDFVCLGNVPAA